MDDLFHRMKDIQRLLGGPLADFQREMERQREVLELAAGGSLVRRALEEAQRFSRLVNIGAQMRSTVNSVQAISAQLSPTLTALKMLQPRFEQADGLRAAGLAADLVRQYQTVDTGKQLETILGEQQRWWRQLEETQFRPFVSIAQQAAEDLRRYVELDRFGCSFAGDLLERLSKIENAEGEAGFSTTLEEAVSWFTNQVDRRKQSASTYLSLLSIFLTIVIFLVQVAQSRQSEESILHRIAESEQRMLSTLQEHAPPISMETLLIVKRRLHLREGPSRRTRSLRVLQPNTAIEKKAEERDWLRVEFFDFGSGEVQVGWVCKRYVAGVTHNRE